MRRTSQLIRLPATWNPVVKMHARVFYTIELLGKPQLHDEVFREINVKGNRLDTPEKIEAFFVARGVSKDEFQKAFSSLRGRVEGPARRGPEPPLQDHGHADHRRQRQVHHGRRPWPVAKTSCSR